MSRGARMRSPARASFPTFTRRRCMCWTWRPRPPAQARSPQFAALPRIRLAEPFEELRDASDRMLATTGARPKVFLANLGKLSDFTARTLFARNFFEAGGIEAVIERRLRQPRRHDRGVQGIGREARVPVLVRQGLCDRGGRCREGADGGRRRAYLSGGPSGRARRRAEGRRRQASSTSAATCWRRSPKPRRRSASWLSEPQRRQA